MAKVRAATLICLVIVSPLWGIENEGVAPDIEVEWTPKTVIEGTDPQLERAIVHIMKELQDYQGIKKLEESPPNPTYHRN